VRGKGREGMEGREREGGEGREREGGRGLRLPLSKFLDPPLHCIDKLFMQYFHKTVVGFWWLRPRPPPGLHPWTPLGDCPRTLICPPMEKNSAGAHICTETFKRHGANGQT